MRRGVVVDNHDLDFAALGAGSGQEFADELGRIFP